jgi:hypothetical protein
MFAARQPTDGLFCRGNGMIGALYRFNTGGARPERALRRNTIKLRPKPTDEYDRMMKFARRTPNAAAAQCVSRATGL